MRRLSGGVAVGVAMAILGTLLWTRRDSNPAVTPRGSATELPAVSQEQLRQLPSDEDPAAETAAAKPSTRVQRAGSRAARIRGVRT